MLRKLFILISLLFCSACLFAAVPSEKKSVRTAVIFDASGIDDKAYNETIWKGVVSYYKDNIKNPKYSGIKYDYRLCSSEKELPAIVSELNEEKFDLIIIAINYYSKTISELSKKYPQIKFAVLDSEFFLGENVMSIAFDSSEGSYLVGLVAALQAKEDGIKNPVFGFIGGVKGPAITMFEMGYIQGIKSVFPDSIIIDYYTDSWNAPIKANLVATRWYDSGVYAIFCVAGRCGLGVIGEAKEQRIKGKNVWAIGVDRDQYVEGIYSGTKSAVLTSMTKDAGRAAAIAIKAVEDEVFKGCVIELELKDNALGFTHSNKMLKSSVVFSAENARKAIITGRIEVYKTYKESHAKGIAPLGLSAKD